MEEWNRYSVLVVLVCTLYAALMLEFTISWLKNLNPILIQVLKVIVHACPKVGLALGFVGLTYPSCIPNVVSAQDVVYLFSYTLFPLLLLLDAAVDCRSLKKVDSEEKLISDVPKMPHKVSDSVAEGVLHCLEELLKKCQLGSVDQMVVVLKKLTYGALLSASEAAEEFRVRNTEAQRGHRGSAKLRVEAFLSLRMLVAKKEEHEKLSSLILSTSVRVIPLTLTQVGSADALAFFLPGVVSQFSKVLYVSKTMISGAAGSVEAIDQAIRGVAEFLMVVLRDDANLSGLDNVIAGCHTNKDESTQSFLEELRQLPLKAQGQSETIAEDSSGEIISSISPKFGFEEKGSISSRKMLGSLHVTRTKDWIEKTSTQVDKLLCTTFPKICVHPAKKVRRGLLVAIQGLLSKCSHTLKKSRLMLLICNFWSEAAYAILECLCVLVCDDSEEVSAVAQGFLEYLFSSSDKHHIECDVAEIFSRLIENLPKVVLGSEESVALSHAQQLLVLIYFSGPQFVVDHLLQSPIKAARFLDVFALCLSQNSVFSGSIDKLLLERPSSTGYLQSVAELKSSIRFTSDDQATLSTAPYEISKFAGLKDKEIQYPLENMQKDYELPHMPPWFVYVGSQKLYKALAGILRLVGLSTMADFRSEGYLSVITDIPLGYFRKLVSEVRMREYSKESWQSWYHRTGSGQLLRQASTAACMLNEMIFGISDQAVEDFARMFQKSKINQENMKGYDAGFSGDQHYRHEAPMINESIWRVWQGRGARSHLIDCIGNIMHEYLSSEVWDLPTEQKSSLLQADGEAGNFSLHFLCDTTLLHQEIYSFFVIIDGIGIFNICLGNDFASSGFLHSSLYLLLENLICPNFQIRRACDAILHVLATTSGYSTVGHLVLENADYVIDSICRQLRHLDLNPHVPNVLGAMLSYIGIAHKILPLLEEPMRTVSMELEILGRHQHPDLTIPFLKVILI
uniref:TTI1 N-terminal TPR domain-containing protein n=1 Tax=Vitis vinifera TaxID=29760 RepID=A5BQW7_VITVI|nr:hypothetical protein VITISV_007255 [Vitis vinifera]